MDTRTSAPHHVKPARRRRWLLWLPVIALILVVPVWIAYQQRVALFINTVDRLLQPYNMQVDNLAGLNLRTTTLVIRQLDLRHHDSATLQSLRDITVDFNAAALLRGRVDSITVAFAGINIPDLSGDRDPPAPDRAQASPAGSDVPVPDAQAQLTDLLANIPFSRLHIEHLQITGNDLSAGIVRAADLAADLRAIELTCRPAQCQASADISLTLDSLHIADDLQSITLDLITFNTDAPITLSVQADTNTVALSVPSSTLALPAIRVDDTLTGMVASVRRLNISQPLSPPGIDLAELYGQAEVSVRELYTNLVDINLWSMQLDQHLTLERGTVHAAGALVHGNQRLLRNELHHDLTLGTGQGMLGVPALAFNDSNTKLSDLISPLPWPADILAGTASAHARLNWQTANHMPVVTGTVQVTLDDLSGYFNEIAFLRLSADFAAELMPDWQLRSTRTASVSLASLDAGIELGNLRSDVRIDSSAGSISLTDASLNVFGGTISSERLDYHLQDNDSHFTIIIDSIDLNQVLGMSAYQGVSATGLVSGQLPVRLQGLTPSISGGTLTALQPGGTIRYHSGPASAGSSESLELVYQALEHYRFSLMETQVDYQESGELDLAIRMEGISPELNGGQRINLNLNINDDIPALLQSLQAARSVTDSIQARLDARQE